MAEIWNPRDVLVHTGQAPYLGCPPRECGHHLGDVSPLPEMCLGRRRAPPTRAGTFIRACKYTTARLGLDNDQAIMVSPRVEGMRLSNLDLTDPHLTGPASGWPSREATWMWSPPMVETDLGDVSPLPEMCLP